MGSFQNEAILQSLLQMEDDGPYSPQSLCQSSGLANNEQKKGKSPTQEYLSFFWDESASNQATIELLMKNEELERQSMSVWEEKEIVFAHQAKSSRSRTETEPAEQAPVQYFPWEDPDTVAGLLEVEALSRRASNDSPFLWDDPAAIGMLLTDEEDEALLAREDKTDMTEELLPECMTWDSRRPREEKRREEEEKTWPRDKTWTREEKTWPRDKTWTREEKTKSRDKTWTREEKTMPRDKTWTREEKREYTTWEQWSLWDQFGSTGEIIQAFEEVAEGRGSRPWNRQEVNVDDAFWNITMSATSQDSGLDTPRRHKSSNQQKDPLNTFKAFRYIFDEVEHQPWLSKGKQERTKGKKKEEDMLDIYADWALATLDMKKMEKYDKEEMEEGEED